MKFLKSTKAKRSWLAYEKKELIRRLTDAGCIFVRRGARHDLYVNPKTGKKQAIPKHREIDESLVRHILKIMT